MTKCRASAVLLVASGLSSLQAADNEAVTNEMKKLQGTWQLVSAQLPTLKLGQGDLGNTQLIIKGNTFRSMQDGHLANQGTFSIIEVSGKTRKTDATYSSPSHLNGKTFPHLAEWVDRDTFRICLPCQWKENVKRPTEFSTGADRLLVIFKRVKN